jgi:hypothetical protein
VLATSLDSDCTYLLHDLDHLQSTLPSRLLKPQETLVIGFDLVWLCWWPHQPRRLWATNVGDFDYGHARHKIGIDRGPITGEQLLCSPSYLALFMRRLFQVEESFLAEIFVNLFAKALYLGRVFLAVNDVSVTLDVEDR